MHGIYDSGVESTAAFGLKLEQPAKGYRYSIDAFLLAFFASRFQGEHVVEFGCGSGVISLLMAALSPSFKTFELFEIQPELCRYANRNVTGNRMPNREFTVRCEDVRYAIVSVKADIVVCNPPFRNPESGRISANFQRAIARNWFFLDPESLFSSFLRMRAGESAGLCVVLPFRDFKQWERAAARYKLSLSHKISVHSFKDREAGLVLARFSGELVKTAVNKIVLYEKDGGYTEITREILGII